MLKVGDFVVTFDNKRLVKFPSINLRGHLSVFFVSITLNHNRIFVTFHAATLAVDDSMLTNVTSVHFSFFQLEVTELKIFRELANSSASARLETGSRSRGDCLSSHQS